LLTRIHRCACEHSVRASRKTVRVSSFFIGSLSGGYGIWELLWGRVTTTLRPRSEALFQLGSPESVAPISFASKRELGMIGVCIRGRRVLEPIGCYVVDHKALREIMVVG